VLDSDYKKFYVLLALVLISIVATTASCARASDRAFVAIKSDEPPPPRWDPDQTATHPGFAGVSVVRGGGAMYAALIGHLRRPPSI